MTWDEEPVRVRVPATSANLGPGFDALGLALSLYNEVEARVVPSGLHIDVSGEGAADVTDAEEAHLVVRAMRAAFDDLGGGQPPGIELRCVNRIPHGRGLGSSAAAIVAGVLAARALAGAAAGPDEALPLANALEGHPDNVAPCLYGGLTIAWLADEGAERLPGQGTADSQPEVTAGAVPAVAARAVRLEPVAGIMPVVLIAPGRFRRRRRAGCCRPGYRTPTRRGTRGGRRCSLPPSPPAPRRCSTLPRTGCTRITAPRRCPPPAIWSAGCGLPECPPWCPARGLRCSRSSLQVVAATASTEWIQS